MLKLTGMVVVVVVVMVVVVVVVVVVERGLRCDDGDLSCDLRRNNGNLW
ncbi:hypothetical protein E2C01_087721 [Portunus trituberculatus]|uniref:Transmembrane protein n=1 Tax=Portunus trituberculatus TaxID=210409 RepID=A0A5B7J498_PORTR|nr:hypothetical protein [Portunus trituberculatus]